MFCFQEPSLYTLKAIAILDNDGNRLLAKVFRRIDPKVIKLFSCLTLLSMKIKRLINVKIARVHLLFKFKSSKPVAYLDCWHFNIYEQDKFHAQLS